MKKSLLALIALILVGALIAVGISCSNNIEDEIKLTQDEVASSQTEAVPSGSEGSGTQSGNSGSAPSSTPAPVKKVSITLPSVVDAGSTVTFSSAVSNVENQFKYTPVSELATITVSEETQDITVESNALANNNGPVIIKYTSGNVSTDALAKTVSTSGTVKTVDLDRINNQPLVKRAADNGYTKDVIEEYEEQPLLGNYTVVLEFFPEEANNGQKVTLYNVVFKLDGETVYEGEIEAQYLIAGASTKQLRIDFSEIPAGSYESFELSFNYGSSEGKKYPSENQTYNTENLSEGFKSIYVSPTVTNNLWVVADLSALGMNDKSEVKVGVTGLKEYERLDRVSLRFGDGYALIVKDNEKVNVPYGTYNNVKAVVETSYTGIGVGSDINVGQTKIRYSGEITLDSQLVLESGKSGDVTIDVSKLEADKALITIESYFAASPVDENWDDAFADPKAELVPGCRAFDKDDENRITIKKKDGTKVDFNPIAMSFTPVDVMKKDGYDIYIVKYHMHDADKFVQVESGGIRSGGNPIMVNKFIPWLEPGIYSLTYNGCTFDVFVGSGESEFVVVGKAVAKDYVESDVIAKAANNKDLTLSEK